MTLTQLQEVMLFHLKNFAKNADIIDMNTRHDAVLSEEDGRGTANSKRLYKGIIRFTLITDGHDDIPWPNHWMELTILELSPLILST